MIKKCVIIAAVVFSIASTCFACPWKLVEDTHIVKHGETLDSITVKYMMKNTYGPREFKEFQWGIKELNTWLFDRDCKEGDSLRINYWVKNKEG